MRTRSTSGMKVSSVRVITTRYLPDRSSSSRSSMRKLQDDVLFHLAAARHRAVVDAAMAGIEHDDRTRIAPLRAVRARRPRGVEARTGRFSAASAFMKLSRSVAARSTTSRAGWPAAASITKALSIRTGLPTSITMREPPCMTRPKRNALTRPRLDLAGLGRQAERHLRQIDHHAIGIGERERPQIDLLGEIHDKAGLGVVAADPGVGRDRMGTPVRPLGRGGDSRPRQQQQARQNCEVRRPNCHESRASVTLLLH